MSDTLKVLNIHAVPDSTEVVSFESGRDGPSGTLIGICVGENGLARTTEPKAAVALGADSADPEMAPAWIDPYLRIEPLIYRQCPWAFAASHIGLKSTLYSNLRLRLFTRDIYAPSGVVAAYEAHGHTDNPPFVSVSHWRRLRELSAATLAKASLIRERAKAEVALVFSPRRPRLREVVIGNVSRALVRRSNFAAAPACTNSHRGIIA